MRNERKDLKTIKDRLTYFIEEYLSMSVRGFETECKLSNGFVSKNRKAIRPVNVELISKRFPQLNTKWLQTGEGEMVTKEYSGDSYGRSLPYFEVDIASDFDSVVNDSDVQPDYYIHVPAFRNCDCAVPVFGRSMTPDINDGAIIAVKELPIDALLPGEAYLIVTREYRTVRYIRTCNGEPSKLRLVPRNLEEYDETLIDIDKIERLFLVKGVITNKVI